MKLFKQLFLFAFFLLWASLASARQADSSRVEEALAKLKQITLPSSKGDSVNVGEAIAGNPFTLIVMYRGVW